MQDNNLPAQNAALTALLKQAGLDAQASVLAARIQSVLTDELHHRMKNMLTMVTAIVRQSLRAADTLVTAERAVATRLMAMAKAHDLLLRMDWKAVALKIVITGTVEQHSAAVGRIVVEGDNIEIGSAAVMPLTLLINELCTNATKYGSLSNEGGHVRLSWEKDSTGQWMTFRWIETGGPPVERPLQSSFGTRLLQEALPRQLLGQGELSFPAGGVEYELKIPMSSLRPVAPS
ncbi:MAG TPA: sensor histidine kinase [Rhizomicrobium sp.]|nr:sensor histidine kinase [Rhizomicrobium sp.]